jgi:hypothetical protein
MSYAYADDSRTRAIRLTGRVRLADGERAESWNQVAYEGEWNGHPSGPFKFTRADFDAIIANFRRREQGIPATFGHPRDSVQAALAGQAGRVVDLRIGEDPKGRGASLEALIRFTPRAAEMVRAGELEHCSVVVGFESVDEVTGEEIGPELYELGLVVQPFLADMRPLQLSAAHRGATNERKLAMSIKDILLKAAEELADDASLEAVEAYIEGAMKQAAAVDGEMDTEAAEDAEMTKDVAASDAPPAEVAPVAAAEPPMGDAEMMAQQAVDFVTAAGEALGTDAAGALAAMQENLDAILSLLSGGADGGTSADDVAAMSKDVLALSRRIKELEADLSARKAAEAAAREDARLTACCARIDAKIAAGELAKEARDAMVRLAKRGDDVLDDALSAHTVAAPKVPEGRRYEASGRQQVAASKSPADAKRVALERLTPTQRYEYDSKMAVHRDHDRALKSALEINK